jgi:hypothetical protein
MNFSRLACAPLLAALAACSGDKSDAEGPPAELRMPLVVSVYSRDKHWTLSEAGAEKVVRLYNDLNPRESTDTSKIAALKIEPVHQFLLFRQAPAPGAVPDHFLHYYDPEGVLHLSSGKFFRVNAALKAKLDEALQWR